MRRRADHLLKTDGAELAVSPPVMAGRTNDRLRPGFAAHRILDVNGGIFHLVEEVVPVEGE